MLGPSNIGHEFPEIVGRVEPGRIRFFRKVIDATDVLSEVLPPTYLFSLNLLDAERPLQFIEDLGISMSSVLHADQTFKYHLPVRVADTLTFHRRVSDVFDRKGGALTFVVEDVRVTNQNGEHVADMRQTLVVRNGKKYDG